jgi:hypothetical protein
MEQSYAWISTCLACDAKVICQAITGLIGEVGENMNKARKRAAFSLDCEKEVFRFASEQWVS